MNLRKIGLYVAAATLFLFAGMLIGVCFFYTGNIDFMPVYILIATCGGAGAMALVLVDSYVQTQAAGPVQTKLVRVK
ncbi:MAG: hypothetical protein KBC21_02175 [Candidatus Pacebacteria bacterium]|nr:hypothetical protein [Candidatus Paceibacterota bacterium]